MTSNSVEDRLDEEASSKVTEGLLRKKSHLEAVCTKKQTVYYIEAEVLSSGRVEKDI